MADDDDLYEDEDEFSGEDDGGLDGEGGGACEFLGEILPHFLGAIRFQLW